MSTPVSSRSGRAVRTFLMRAWLPVTIVAVWWFATRGRDSLYFPSFETIVHTVVHDWFGPHFTADLLPSVVKFVVGFTLAALLGVTLGVAIGMSPTLRAATDPVIQFLRSLPPPVLLPIGLLLFGIGPSMNISIIVIGAIWPTLLNTVDGVRSVDPQLVDVARSYRIGRVQRLRCITLPSASPQIFGGMRTTLQVSIILIVVSEMVASTNGIGYYVLNSQQTFEVAHTWAGTIVLGLLGYLANLIFVQVENRVLRWQTGLRASTGGA